MSAGPAVAPVLPVAGGPAPTRAPAPTTPLVLLPAPARQAPLAPYTVLLGSLLAAGLLALLMLNTVLAQDAFRLHDLQKSTTSLAEREQELGSDLDRRLSPGALAESGRALGLVPVPAPVFLRLDDGAVLGSPSPALAPPAPAVPAPSAVDAAATTSPATSAVTPGSDQ